MEVLFQKYGAEFGGKKATFISGQKKGGHYGRV
jgi:hypothetical protein